LGKKSVQKLLLFLLGRYLQFDEIRFHLLTNMAASVILDGGGEANFLIKVSIAILFSE
jgi:hypothetical protein